MKPTGIRRIRPWSCAVALVAAVSLAGCSQQFSKTFDNSPDPELDRPGAFPNINVAGEQPPGRLMPPDELKGATGSLKARAGQNNPRTAADARKASAASSTALEKTAATHAQDTLSQIQDRCGEPGADATKCPQ
jgi:hypothetical protein